MSNGDPGEVLDGLRGPAQGRAGCNIEGVAPVLSAADLAVTPAGPGTALAREPTSVGLSATTAQAPPTAPLRPRGRWRSFGLKASLRLCQAHHHAGAPIPSPGTAAEAAWGGR